MVLVDLVGQKEHDLVDLVDLVGQEEHDLMDLVDLVEEEIMEGTKALDQEDKDHNHLPKFFL